jgi:DNA mismatch repair ATPase MutS
MDKALHNSLEFGKILDLINPAGESGKHFKYHLVPFKPGQEAELKKQYQRLEHLVLALKSDKKTQEQLGNALSLIPFLNTTLKAVTERQLLLHECFELKKMLHYARLLKANCDKAGILKHYPFPELDKIYAILDADKTQTPVFALNEAYSKGLAKCLDQMQDLHLKQRQIEHKLLAQAQKELDLNAPVSEVVVSRLDSIKVKLFSKSKRYILADENFANLTFRLKESRELSALKKRAILLKAKLSKVEDSVLQYISNQLRRHIKAINKTADIIRILDWDYAKAMFAMRYNCINPQIHTSIKINVTQATNLPLKIALLSQNRRYQALDLQFTGNVNVVTGPNMGGKTTALKTLGQLALMAQYALPIPAIQAQMCLFDSIWYNQELERSENLSSFGREIVSLVTVLKKKGRSLLLLDELAKGTNPKEGEAILTAVLRYLSGKASLTVAATHFEQPAHLRKVVQFAIKGLDIKALKQLSSLDKASLNTQLDLLNQLMDYSLVRLYSKDKPPLNAIPIAKVLGLDESIISDAERLLK